MPNAVPMMALMLTAITGGVAKKRYKYYTVTMHNFVFYKMAQFSHYTHYYC